MTAPDPCLRAAPQEYEYSAPKFAELGAGLDAMDSGDDDWFEREHPEHESSRPRKPPRPSLPAPCVPPA